MIENRFAITLEGLKETSPRVIRETPKFRKLSIFLPVMVVVLFLIIYLMQANTTPVLLVLIGVALLFYIFGMLRKIPLKMAENIYSDMQKKYGEPITHTRMTEGGILVLDQDEDGDDDRMYPFSCVRLLFATEHFIVAMTDSNRAVDFRKDSFLSGDEAQLIALFRAHCPQAKFDKSIG